MRYLRSVTLFFAIFMLLLFFLNGEIFAQTYKGTGYKIAKSIRTSNEPVLTRSYYDYAPSLMEQDGTYKMWWCGGPTDKIYYATASNPSGPWRSSTEWYFRRKPIL